MEHIELMCEYFVMQKNKETDEVFEHGPFIYEKAIEERDFYRELGYPDSYIFMEQPLWGT